MRLCQRAHRRKVKIHCRQKGEIMKHIMFQSISIFLLFCPILIYTSNNSSSSSSSSLLSTSRDSIARDQESQRRREVGSFSKVGSPLINSPSLKFMSDEKRRKLNGRLIRAVRQGKSTDVEKALSDGADPNCGNELFRTPLHIAAHLGSIRMIHALVSRGAQINVKDDEDWPPLFHAANMDHYDAVALLLAHKANIFASKGDRISFISYFKKVESIEKAITLPACIAPLQASFHFRQNLFFKACQYNSLPIMRMLLDHGFEVNGRLIEGSSKGFMPLHVAVAQDACDVTELLLARSADVHAVIAGADNKEHNGRTPYNIALGNAGGNTVEKLLQAGVAGNIELLGDKIWRTRFMQRPKELRDRFNAELLQDKPEFFKALCDNNVPLDPAIIAAINVDTMLGIASPLTALIIKRHHPQSSGQYGQRQRSTISDIEQLLYSGKVLQLDLMAHDASGNSPFLWAASCGNLPAMKLIINCASRLPLSLPLPVPIGFKAFKAFVMKKFGKASKVAAPISFDRFCKDRFGCGVLEIARKRKDVAMINYWYALNAGVRAEIINAWCEKYPSILAPIAHIAAEYVYGAQVPVLASQADEGCASQSSLSLSGESVSSNKNRLEKKENTESKEEFSGADISL
jgi:ankyrin repeat protein